MLLTLSGFLVAFGEELHGLGCPQRCANQPLSADVLSKLSQDGAVGVPNVSQLAWVYLVLSFAHTIVLWPVGVAVHSGCLLCAQHWRDERKPPQCLTSGLRVFLKSFPRPDSPRPETSHMHRQSHAEKKAWIIVSPLVSGPERLRFHA